MTPADFAAMHAAAFDFPRPWSEAEFASLIADPAVLLVADKRGFLVARTAADEAEILTLAVAPEARRRGIGRSLIRRFLVEAGRRGASRAFLEVAASNAPAIALYLSEGFARSGTRPAYFRRPDGSREDALVLSRAVPALV